MKGERRHQLGVLAACFSLLTSVGFGQPAHQLVGSWYEPQYNLSLVISGDAHYDLSTPVGATSGQVAANGEVLWLQDSTSGQAVQYALVRVNDTELVLRDAMGVVMSFRRRTAASSGPAATQTLATKDGVTLTSDHVRPEIDLVQFILGHSILPEEAESLQSESVRSFTEDPAALVKDAETLASTMQQVHALTDPTQIGLVRQQLLLAIYQAASQLPAAQQPQIAHILGRYVRVLAVDAANSLILTDRDADAMLKHSAFLSQLAGQAMQVDASQRQAYHQQLSQLFPSMALEQKQQLCSSSILWEIVEANWNRMNAQQRQQFAAAYQAQLGPPQVQGSPGQWQGNGSAAPWGGGQTGSNDIDDHTYELLSRLNLDSHVASLNAIEAIDGSGDYWEVVEYDY